jgi:hypothetical protein
LTCIFEFFFTGIFVIIGLPVWVEEQMEFDNTSWEKCGTRQIPSRKLNVQAK